MTDSTAELVTFATKRALVTLARHEGPTIRVFMPSLARVFTGAQVRLKVGFADNASKTFFIHGTVMSTQQASPGRPAGFELCIATPEEYRAWSNLYAFCARNQEPAKRHPTMLRCSVNTGDEKVEGLIRDLSMTGAFVVVQDRGALKVGSAVTIDVASGLFGLRSTKLKAQIVWQGKKQNSGGVGASFTGSAQPVIALMKRSGLG